jgi:hypothetical protein
MAGLPVKNVVSMLILKRIRPLGAIEKTRDILGGQPSISSTFTREFFVQNFDAKAKM